jgi:endoglucanase
MRRASLALILCIELAGPSLTAAPKRPFPHHTGYASGAILPSHRTQKQLDDDVRARYEVWKTRYLRDAGTDASGSRLYRVSFGKTNPSRTVSEGQGYGMVIVAMIAGHDENAQAIFDGLWRFARRYRSAGDARLMAWEVPPGDGDSAFDGDADIAYALLLANTQWGNGGDVDYLREAKRVIAGIRDSTIGPRSRLPMLGDWVDPDGGTRNQYTVRTSDFMPACFRAFGRATGDRVWNDVVAATQAAITSLQVSYASDTGLVPDFIVPATADNRSFKPAPPNFLEAATDGDYSYNAGRVPWRLGTDAVLAGDDVSRAQAVRIARWARTATNGDPRRIQGGYRLDGTVLPGRDYFTSFFAAPIGVAAMSDPGLQQWLNAIYDSVRVAEEDYYEDTVTLLCMFVMTGNAWEPAVGRRRSVRK